MKKEIIDIIGTDAMEKLVECYGGKRIYIPSHMPDPLRNNRVIVLFSESLKAGSTCENAYRRASEEIGVSVRQVKRIVAAS